MSWSLFLVLTVSASVLALLPSADEARAAERGGRAGRLDVQVSGLPKHQRPVGVLRGPGLKQRVMAQRLTLRAVKPGRYTLTLRKVKISRPSGAVKRGATAIPSTTRVAVRVRSGRRTKLASVYGTIINPGVVSLKPQGVLSSDGPPGDPTSLVLDGRQTFARNAILSIPPSTGLSRGVLSHVRSATHAAGRTRVALRAASVYEVAPAIEFDVPLHVADHAQISAASCGGVSGVKPYRRINDISFSGGWNTKRVLRQDVKVGVRALVHFNVEAGVDVTGGVGVECSARASVSASGMAGPIPVTAGIEGELTAFAGAGGKLKSGGSMHVDAGASTIGVPPTMAWLPEVRFSNPRFSFSAERFAQARATIGIGVKAGIGNDSVASATLKIGATTELSARPGSCSWDARFGQFSTAGKILRWTIETPKTPAFFTKNLWRSPCGSGSQPSPGGSPGDPAPGPGPVTRPPVDRITPLTPTRGPVGFGPGFTGPACTPDAGEWASLAVAIDGVNRYTSSWYQLASPGWASTLDTSSNFGEPLSAGTHRASFKCVLSREDGSQRILWSDTGFDVELTGSSRSVVVESDVVRPGDAVTFVSGATRGAAPCPSIEGATDMIAQVSLYGPHGGTPVATRGVPLPTTSASEPLVVPAETPNGTTLRATVRCHYSYPTREVAVYVFDSIPILAE